MREPRADLQSNLAITSFPVPHFVNGDNSSKHVRVCLYVCEEGEGRGIQGAAKRCRLRGFFNSYTMPLPFPAGGVASRSDN